MLCTERGKKTDCNKIDNIQFLEKVFGGSPVAYITIIENGEVCHFDQGVLCRMDKG